MTRIGHLLRSRLLNGRIRFGPNGFGYGPVSVLDRFRFTRCVSFNGFTFGDEENRTETAGTKPNPSIYMSVRACCFFWVVPYAVGKEGGRYRVLIVLLSGFLNVYFAEKHAQAGNSTLGSGPRLPPPSRLGHADLAVVYAFICYNV